VTHLKDLRAVRDRLVALLGIAAQIEHAVCCQYLFAAHSMKALPGEAGCTYVQLEHLRQWKGTLLSIARMEMEHLAIVANVLTAIGEPAEFERPSFPTLAGAFPIDRPFSLRPYSLDALADFVLVEFPDHVTAAERAFIAYLKGSPLEQDRALAGRIATGRRSLQRNSLAALYEEVEGLFEALDDTDAATLFVGPPAAQVTGTTLFPTNPPQPANVRVYDVLLTSIDGRASAVKAIQRIRREGEGAPSRQLQEGGHFGRFTALYQALSEALQRDPGFVPSRPVVDNPVTPVVRGILPAPTGPTVTLVTSPTAVAAMQAYDLAYDTCLKLLAMLFSQTPGDLGYVTLQDIVFFPMMTLVLRPLGDLLTQLPAADRGAACAGPSFLAPASVALARPSVAWDVIAEQLDELADRCDALAKRRGLAPSVHERLSFLAGNTWRLAKNYTERVTIVGQP
jgi:Ferritin-like